MTLPTLSRPPRTAWVSGASSGLGAAIAAALLAQGVRVWGTAREPERLVSLQSQGNFVPVVMDLEKRELAVKSYLDAEQAAGGFDLVVHNAGYGVFGAFAELPAATWSAQVDAMVGAMIELNHASFSAMLARRSGTLVNVSSLAVDYPLPYMAGYNVSKAALSALSESLIFEAAGTPIVIIDFRPGDIRTDFNRAVRRPGQPGSARQQAAWSALERNLANAPGAERVVAQLWAAINRGQSRTVYSGGFFQAKVASFFARLAPSGMKRRIAARYFGVNTRG